MIIKKIKATNYKTYLSLNLDLSVDEERPLILVGGMNGGGKTTLFEAIYGALYGLKIKDKAHFAELLNNGAANTQKPTIELELTFVGMVLGQEQKYVLKRTYALNPSDMPVENVNLNMNGNVLSYGTFTPSAQRIEMEQQVNKVIKANLPQELSQYFLFDAMQSSELLKENVFAQIIRDNIENVMGFKKYVQLKKAAERLQQEWASQRLNAQKQKKEYDTLCAQKIELLKSKDANAEATDLLYKYLTEMKDNYNMAKAGAENDSHNRIKIQEFETKIKDIDKQIEAYYANAKTVSDNLENNVFFAKVATNLETEVNNIVRLKDELKHNNEDSITKEKLQELTSQVIDYLKMSALCSKDVDANDVLAYLINKQTKDNKEDPYSFLDGSEITALSEWIHKGTINDFMILDRNRQDLEAKVSNLPNWKMQIDTLRKAQTGGNEQLIKDYEQKERELDNLKKSDIEKDAQITTLERRIHQFDVQIQQEPDKKYDTLVKLKPFFENIADSLLKFKKNQIETEMQEQLNKMLISYKNCISKVVLSDSLENFSIKMFHKAGNEISLNQLNAASKQIFIQVLLKVLRNLGDYNPPVMIDTVMGVLDEESRDVLMEEYFPTLAEQTILLCTTSEIRKNQDYKRLEPFISKTYTLNRDVEQQCTTVEDGYFGLTLNN